MRKNYFLTFVIYLFFIPLSFEIGDDNKKWRPACVCLLGDVIENYLISPELQRAAAVYSYKGVYLYVSCFSIYSSSVVMTTMFPRLLELLSLHLRGGAQDFFKF